MGIHNYDSLGRRTRQTFQDGSRWEYGYNDRSEVTTANRTTADGTPVPPLAATYAYDGIGNRISSTSPVLGDHDYTANGLNQYATITTGAGRTAVGRAPAAWNVQVAGVNAARIGEFYHRGLTASNATAPVWQSVVTRRDSGTPSMTHHFWYAAASVAPTHDADGNLTNDGRWAYEWDAENRLIQMESTAQATAAGHPYTKLKFVYDWQGRRIARHVWQGGTQASPVFKSSHRWLYDRWNAITEFTAPSATSTTLTRLNTYTWGLDLSGTLQGAGGVGGLLALNHQPSATSSAPSFDGNGNIVAWTRSDASAPTSRREYDAFGNTLVSEGIAPCGFGFSTKMQDGETGLYYYGYRYYDPVTGRWPSRDPKEEVGGFNLHALLSNAPINQVDVWGREPFPTVGKQVRQKVGDTEESYFETSFPNILAKAKEICKREVKNKMKHALCSKKETWGIAWEGGTEMAIYPDNWTTEGSEPPPGHPTEFMDNQLGDTAQTWFHAWAKLGQFTFRVAIQHIGPHSSVDYMTIPDHKACTKYSYRFVMEARDNLGIPGIGTRATRASWTLEDSVDCCADSCRFYQGRFQWRSPSE